MQTPQTASILHILIFCLGVSSCGSKTQNDASQNTHPYQYQSPTGPHGELRGENNFAALIQRYSRGKPKQMPWAGYWWPFSEDGIAEAASKYEQATGQTGAVNWELLHHGPSIEGLQPWWGHCNGWSAAAVLFPEPTAPQAHHGIVFTVGDQKALLTEIAQEVNADFFGQRADTNDTSDPNFQDIFPDQFFLVLTNIIGKGQPAIMDRYTGDQTWNQPIAGYQIAPITPADDLGADPSAPDVFRVMVTTQIWWLRDDVQPDHVTEPFTFSDGPSYDSRILRYEVWLDAPVHFDSSGHLVSSGNVILTHQGQTVYGGAWRDSGSDILESHPDYLWVPNSLAPPSQFANPDIRPPVVQTLVNST